MAARNWAGWVCGLTAVAWAGDEVIEAVELTGHSFTIGLRWPPGESDGARLFEGFGAAAAVRAAGRDAAGGPDRSDGAGATDGAGAGPGPEGAGSTAAAEGTEAAEGTGGAESSRQGTQMRKVQGLHLNDLAAAAARAPGFLAPASRGRGSNLPCATCIFQPGGRQKVERAPNISGIRFASARSPSIVIRPSTISG